MATPRKGWVTIQRAADATEGDLVSDRLLEACERALA
jgi:hypothetical protein